MNDPLKRVYLIKPIFTRVTLQLTNLALVLVQYNTTFNIVTFDTFLSSRYKHFNIISIFH